MYAEKKGTETEGFTSVDALIWHKFLYEILLEGVANCLYVGLQSSFPIVYTYRNNLVAIPFFLNLVCSARFYVKMASWDY